MRPSRCRLLLALVVAAALGSRGASAQVARPTTAPAPRQADSAAALTPAVGAPVVFRGDTLLVVLTRIGPFTPSERAAAIAARVARFASRVATGADSVAVADGEGATDLLVGQDIVMSVTDADARAAGQPRRALAEGYARNLTAALRGESRLATAKALATGLLWSVLATAVFALALRLGGSLLRRITAGLGTWGAAHLKAVRIQKVEFVSAQRLTELLLGAIRVARAAMMLVLAYFYLVAVLSFFPWTQHLAGSILGYVLEPLGRAWRGFTDYLPSVFFIAVIAVLTRYALKLVHVVFRAVATGALTFRGFHAEWGEPTYKIVRFLVLAFAVVVAFPYLPGSRSDAFKGVSLFLGVLFSLGSSSAIANIVAGIVLTYTRAFQAGDRVQIGATTGDVVEKTLLVTRVRTIKNEDVTIPNAIVLGSHMTNYSAVAHSKGLVLHTTVTIGYDAPWREVHELLLAAARGTANVLTEPPPFVLQRSLDDFFVTYELNAYTDRPEVMARTYSDLHQNIQDRFNEAGVEIMSPHFAAHRDGNRTAVPEAYLPAGYSAPAFRVTRCETPARQDGEGAGR